MSYIKSRINGAKDVVADLTDNVHYIRENIEECQERLGILVEWAKGIASEKVNQCINDLLLSIADIDLDKLSSNFSKVDVMLERAYRGLKSELEKA